jgi:hypothetical protein
MDTNGWGVSQASAVIFCLDFCEKKSRFQRKEEEGGRKYTKY